ncbi:hypothetical protein Tsubulata_023776 [Turnera subulata]|uniref:Armadillo-like repeats domain-containing protein n=1 Tax=Turnera subulata TaxID=218843 RepID=A0A9Q0J2Z6_9ROSI|nr:hypothetical protein Tsubulata_023776 [Turnera subulata]
MQWCTKSNSTMMVFLAPPPPPSSPFCTKFPKLLFPRAPPQLLLSSFFPRHPRVFLAASAAATGSGGSNTIRQNDRSSSSSSSRSRQQKAEEEVEVEVEEEVTWFQDKALGFVEFTGSVTQAIPGPRVSLGDWSFPVIVALPLAYAVATLCIAFAKTFLKSVSPQGKRRRRVEKNDALNKSIDGLFQKGRDAVHYSALLQLQRKVSIPTTLIPIPIPIPIYVSSTIFCVYPAAGTGFSMEAILRKYIRYALNEKPFVPELVINLIHLRRASQLADSQVAEILNEISRRIVKEKGPIVIDMSRYSEKGFKRKLAVQALFGKVFYLSDLPEFCSRDSSLAVKEIFGVTEEDAEKLRVHTVPEEGDVEALEKLVDGGSDSDTEDDWKEDDSPGAPAP